MTESTIGGHVATGSRNGYGKVAPYLRGVISFEYGAFDEVSPNCFRGWRDIKQWAVDPTNPSSGTNADIPPGFDNFTPDMARANARVQWPRFLARHIAQPSDVAQLTNEYGGSDAAHLKALVAFEDELMLLNEAAGHPLTFGVCSCAGDSPGWDTYLWQSILAPHIWKAWGLGHIYIRHAYTGVNPGSPNMMINAAGVPADNNVARPFKEIDWFLSQGEYGACGPIILAESGFVTYPGEPKYSQQMIAYDEYIREFGYDRWIGFQALFTYGEWWQANIEDSSDALEAWLMDNQPTKWIPEFTPTQPDIKHKAIIVKLPQDMTQAEWDATCAYVFPNRHTVTASHGDMKNLLLAGSLDSYVKFAYPERDADSVALVELMEYAWQPLYPTSPPPTGQTIDITQYVMGANLQQFDMDYIHGTQTTMIKHEAGLLYVKGGNGEYEHLWIADYNGEPWIWRADDTSESPTRMYAHYRSQGGALGAPWFPCRAEVGKWYETAKFVQHYNKADCTPLNGGNVTDKLRLISEPYNRTYARTGETLEVVTLEWASGEQYDFGGGNVGFRGAGMDFQFMGWLSGRTPLPIKKYGCFGW